MTEFLNTKAKAFIVFLFSLIALGIFPFAAYGMTLAFTNWYALICGVVLMVIAIPFHIWGKKTSACYIISFAFNTIGNGASAAAYYLEVGIAPDLLEVFFAVIPAAGILFLVYLMLQIFAKTKKFTLIFALIINAMLMIAAIVFWIIDGSIIFSFGFFGLIISLFYLCVFGITIDNDKRGVMRDISFGSFGAFIIITVVVLTILSEGDILDGLDFDIGGKKRRNRQRIS